MKSITKLTFALSNMDSLGAARIKQYAEAGHVIANHTHSHTSMRQLGAQNYIQDIFRAIVSFLLILL